MSTTQPLTFTPVVSNTGIHSLEISNVKEFPGDSEFQILVEGLRNPLNLPSTIGWLIETYAIDPAGNVCNGINKCIINR